MAGDWIKMRTSLLTNPKVNGIARILEGSSEVSAALTTGFSGGMSEIVTRNVMRHVTVSSLLVVWGAANEHTRDGIFANADLSDIDDMVGIPGFGAAMESVGWLVYDEQNNAVTLPNFEEYNTSGSSRSAGAKSAAQRQKEYRDRKRAGVTEGDVTRDVTRDRREEKRREEKYPPTPHDEIVELYRAKLPDLPQPRLKTAKRDRAVVAFWRWIFDSRKSDGQPRAQTADQALTWIADYFARVNSNEWLMGRRPGKGQKLMRLA